MHTTPEQWIEEALARYEHPLIRYAKSVTGDMESARDAVQETFLRLSKQDVLSLSEKLAPWLFSVCKNCAIDIVRKRRFFCDAPENIEEEISPQPSPSDEAENKDSASRLRSLLSQLSPRQQELIRLKFEADLSYKEIAEILRISVSNVGVQLHNTIQSLKLSWLQNQPSRCSHEN